MKAELKSIDISGDYLHDYIKNNNEPFNIDLTLTIGATGVEGANYFFVCIDNIGDLNDDSVEEYSIYKRAAFFAPNFDVNRIEESLRAAVEKVEGGAWEEIVERLCEMFAWEYDGY